jgi:hypothetical protein
MCVDLSILETRDIEAIALGFDDDCAFVYRANAEPWT